MWKHRIGAKRKKVDTFLQSVKGCCTICLLFCPPVFNLSNGFALIRKWYLTLFSWCWMQSTTWIATMFRTSLLIRSGDVKHTRNQWRKYNNWYFWRDEDVDLWTLQSNLPINTEVVVSLNMHGPPWKNDSWIVSFSAEQKEIIHRLTHCTNARCYV